MSWKLLDQTPKFDYAIVNDEGKIVCYSPQSKAVDKERMTLIAAAPDLLESCELALSNLSLPTGVGHTQLMRVKQILSEAINKAGGIN